MHTRCKAEADSYMKFVERGSTYYIEFSPYAAVRRRCNSATLVDDVHAATRTLAQACAQDSSFSSVCSIAAPEFCPEPVVRPAPKAEPLALGRRMTMAVSNLQDGLLPETVLQV